MANKQIKELDADTGVVTSTSFATQKTIGDNNFDTSATQVKVFTNTDPTIVSTDSKGAENAGDYSQNFVPSTDGNRVVPVKYVQPPLLTISTAIATLDNTTTVNQMAIYTGSGGNITIESTFLQIDQEYAIHDEGGNQFTLVAGTGVNLHSPDGLLTSRTQYSTVGIYKKTATTYIITGDLA